MAENATAARLARYRSGDEAARAELVDAWLPLARQVARRYARPGETLDDLVQVATIGLLKAIERFDPDRGFTFSTYALPTIVGELKRYRRETGWAVHVPRAIQERILRINAAMAKLTRDLGRAPSPRELALAIGAEVEEVLEAMEAARAVDAVSLDAPLAGAEETPGTYAETVGAPDPSYETVELMAAIRTAMRAMSRRDQLILRLRFEEDLTQSAIAAELGISQMHVSRLIRRALERLRSAAAAA